MSKSSIVTMPGKFIIPKDVPLGVFVTTSHDKFDAQHGQEGNSGVIAIAGSESEAFRLVDLELRKNGLLPHAAHQYFFRSIPISNPYSELIADAPANGGPDPRSKKARAVAPAPRRLGLASLFITLNCHSYLAGFSGAIAIADGPVLAKELIDASLVRRGLLPNSRRSYSLHEVSLAVPCAEKLTP